MKKNMKGYFVLSSLGLLVLTGCGNVSTFFVSTTSSKTEDASSLSSSKEESSSVTSVISEGSGEERSESASSELDSSVEESSVAESSSEESSVDPHAGETETLTLNAKGGVFTDRLSGDAIANGEVKRTLTYDYGADVTLPIPTRPGAVFGGWSDGSQIVEDGKITADLELTATWYYTVESMGLEGATIDPVKDRYDEADTIKLEWRDIEGKRLERWHYLGYLFASDGIDKATLQYKDAFGVSFGYQMNRPQKVSYIGRATPDYVDVASETDGFEGTYTSEDMTITLDGYGNYVIYDGTDYSDKMSMHHEGGAAWEKGDTENLEFESLRRPNLDDASMGIVTEGEDRYYFIKGTYNDEKEITLWKGGLAPAPEEEESCPAAAYYTSTNEDYDYSFIINENGSAVFKLDGKWYEDLTVSNVDDYPASFTMTNIYGDDVSVTKVGAGYKVDMTDERSIVYTVSDYTFPFVGTFTHAADLSDEADDSNAYTVKVKNSKEAEIFVNGASKGTAGIVEYSFPRSLTLNIENVAGVYSPNDDGTIKISVGKVGTKGRAINNISDDDLHSSEIWGAKMNGDTTSYFSFSAGLDMPFAGTFSYTDETGEADISSASIVINADGSAVFTQDGDSSYYYSVSVSAYDYPSSVTFDIVEAEGDDPFSRTLTYNEAGGYYTGARLGDVRGSAHWTFSKQS